MLKRFSVLFVICALSSGTAQAQQQPCNKAEYQQAEKEAVSLRSWDALYKSYRLYGHCNDVDAAEGYSESVARILVDRWETLPRLSKLVEKDKSFRDFVLGHVDATLDMNDVQKIHARAIQHCPAGLRELCKNLQKQAKTAIEEDASVGHKKQ
jgi:hypothetical protein